MSDEEPVLQNLEEPTEEIEEPTEEIEEPVLQNLEEPTEETEETEEPEEPEKKETPKKKTPGKSKSNSDLDFKTKEIKRLLKEANNTIESSKKKNPSRRTAGLIVGGWVCVVVLFYNVYKKTKFIDKINNVVDGMFETASDL